MPKKVINAISVLFSRMKIPNPFPFSFRYTKRICFFWCCFHLMDLSITTNLYKYVSTHTTKSFHFGLFHTCLCRSFDYLTILLQPLNLLLYLISIAHSHTYMPSRYISEIDRFFSIFIYQTFAVVDIHMFGFVLG